uniref:Uncharacterized protein n=1 Tax=Oryza glumipatula TaxID=40148 RepID=A0A0E0BTL0_9ORYZ
MSSSTSVLSPLLAHAHGRASPTSRAQPLIASRLNLAGFSASSPRWILPAPRASGGGGGGEEEDSRVQELRVPGSWLTPAGAAQESEWLRETLHKWLDDEYCPEPANVDISNTAARSFYESLTAKESDLGEILLKMVGDLQKLSYKESFHGAFSAANAAVSLCAWAGAWLRKLKDDVIM